MHKSLLILLALSALLLAGQVSAAPHPTQGYRASGAVDAVAEPAGNFAMPMARDAVSLDQAAAIVKRRTGGRIIKASSRSSNGRTVHFIRVLTRDGKVFTVRVDASSGRIL